MMRPSGVYSTDYIEDQAIWRTRVDYFWTVFFAVVALSLPLFSASGVFGELGVRFVPETLLGILTDGGILLISIVGLNLLLGYTGQISLGQAAFMMVGAYSSAVLTRQASIPFIFALPIAAVVTGLVGLVFGLASLRVKGFYLAMATLAAQFIIPWAISSYRGDFVRLGGDTGLTVDPARILGIELNTNLEEYYLVLVVAIVMWILARNMVRTRLGRAWIAIRDNDLAAEQLGINVFRYKVLAFFMSAIYAGVAGGLLAHVRRTISPAAFDITESIEMLGMLVIGGAGFPLGPLFGVAFFLFIERWFIDFARDILIDILPSILTFREREALEASLLAGLPPLLFGSFLAIFLIFQPRGLAYRWMIIQAAWRLRPFSKA
ncbi:MAG: branched-chain amino acid ABC transporter permease [Chloroflexi bacterium]|nr:branched-chain amino acid ABC transporter permease [Chloroflexota bacterium]